MAKEADSPNGLSLQAKPTVARTNKRLLWIVIIALLIMIAALVYGVNFASSDKKEEEVAELKTPFKRSAACRSSWTSTPGTDSHCPAFHCRAGTC